MLRLKYLDGIRGIGIVLVLMFHLGYWDFGFSGVELFFVLSGYIISLLLIEEQKKKGTIDLKAFYRRRISRIYPPLFIVLLGILFLTINFPMASIYEKTNGELLFGSMGVANWFDYFRSAGYWEQGVQTPSLHLWSLGIESQFYLVWPVVMKMMMKKIKKVNTQIRFVACVYLISVVVLYLWTRSGVQPVDYYNTFVRSPSFIIGSLWAMISARQKSSQVNNYKKKITVLLTGFLILLTIKFQLISPYLYQLYIPVYSLGAGALFHLMYIDQGTSVIKRIMEWRVFLVLGKISYVLYLVHMPVIIYLNATLLKTFFPINTFFVVVLQVTVSIIISVILNLLIEKKVRLKSIGQGILLICVMPVTIYWMQQQSHLFRVFEPAQQIEAKWIEAGPIVSPKEGNESILIIGDSWSRRTGFGLSLVAQEQAKNYQVLTYGLGNASVMDPTYFIDASNNPVYQAKTFEGYKAYWKQALEDYNPNYVVMQFGNADQSRQMIGQTPMRVGMSDFDERFIAHYSELIAMVTDYKADIIIMNVIHNDYGSVKSMDNKLSNAMNHAIETVNKKHPETYLFDLTKLLEQPKGKKTIQKIKGQSVFDETNHPSYIGSKYIGEKMLGFIESKVKRSSEK